MNTRNDPTLATTHWESKWIAAEGAFDPSYERTTAALRRWIDGMEAALVRQQSGQRTRRAPTTVPATVRTPALAPR
jgi:hypothetical protein